MVLRTLRRGGALALGIILGLGFAFGLCFPHGLTGKPRCPRCETRTQVEEVRYAPLPDGKYSAAAGGRYLGTWDADRFGPEWQCLRCSSGIGTRLPGAQPP